MPKTIIDIATGERTPAPYSETIDNGDGTGPRTNYAADGTVISVEQLTGLPIPEPPEPTPDERIAELESTIDALLDALGGDDD